MAVSRSRTARAARKCKRLDERAFLVRHVEISTALTQRFGAVPPEQLEGTAPQTG